MRFFTADLHLGHDNIIEYCNRPFGSVEEMNEKLVERWNRKVKPTDEVYVLGDVAMGKREENLQYITYMNGKKYLIAGNHDKCWGHDPKAHKTSYHQRMLEMYMEAGFHTIKDEGRIDLQGFRSVILSHFPYVGDHTNEDRYKEVRPKNNGWWLIHGHVHDLWRKRGKMINVGVDAWNHEPVSEYTLATLMRNSSYSDLGILTPTRSTL